MTPPAPPGPDPDPGPDQGTDPDPVPAPDPGPDIEERDPGLALERTALAWTRTAISFAALGGVVLKVSVVSGLLILAVAALVWLLGRASTGAGPPSIRRLTGRGTESGRQTAALSSARLGLMTAAIVAVSLLCLLLALLAPTSHGILR